MTYKVAVINTRNAAWSPLNNSPSMSELIERKPSAKNEKKNSAKRLNVKDKLLKLRDSKMKKLNVRERFLSSKG